MGWIGRSLGQFGSDIGTGHDIAQDWRAREQQMKLDAARQKLQELTLPLQLQEIQARVAEMTQPKPAGLVGTRGGGQAGVTFQPGKGYTLQPLEAGLDADTAKEQISKMSESAPKEFKAALKAQADSIDAGIDPVKALEGAEKLMATASAKEMPTGTTVNRLQQEALDAASRGDLEGYQNKLKQINELSKAAKPQAPTMTGLWWAAQHGDKDAQETLKNIEAKDTRLLMARGEGFARARAQYNFQPFVDDQGQIVAINGVDAKRLYDAGKALTPVSRISAKDANAFQQFSGEAARSIPDVRRWAKAYDNSQDRAIFAGLMAKAGPPPPGGEVGWLRNIVAQAGASGLSPEGKQLNQAISGLNETVGRLRSILGLPATESAMALTLGLVPGPGTPDSKYVLGYDQNGQHWPGQLDRLEAMAGIATGVPAMRGVMGGAGRTPPPGSKIIPLDEFLRQK